MPEEQAEKMERSVNVFLEVYRILSPEGRAQFEAEINAKLKELDEKTRKLYLALIKAAKDGLSTDEAIEEMKKTT